jgi:hypothetical protein
VLWSRMSWAVAVALGALLALAGTASADEPPRVTGLPSIGGTPKVGQQLRALNATWVGDQPLEVSWLWLRCSGGDVRDCRGITNATSTNYQVTSADLGKRIRVLLMLSNRRGSAWAISAATPVVTNATPPPVPTPSPTPVATVTPVPPPVAPPAPAPITSPPVTSPVKAPKMMRPFPVIRIRGSLTRTGAKVTLLTVKAPRGASILLRCIGRSCPRDKWAHTASITHVLPFERRLRAGTRLVITVTRPNRIGKHTTFVIRKGKPPRRVDRCIYPGAKKPTACVAA